MVCCNAHSHNGWSLIKIRHFWYHMNHLMTVGTYSRGTCSSPLPKTIICRAFLWILYWNDLRPSKSEQSGFTGILVLLKIFMFFLPKCQNSPGFIWPQKKRIQIHWASEIPSQKGIFKIFKLREDQPFSWCLDSWWSRISIPPIPPGGSSKNPAFL